MIALETKGSTSKFTQTKIFATDNQNKERKRNKTSIPRLLS